MRSIKINVIYIILFISIYVIYLFHISKLKSLNETSLTTTSELDSVLNPEFKINLQINLEPNDLCKFKSKFLFIYIFTPVKSFTKRQLIRNTWANKSLNLFDFNLVFIIGKTNDSNNKSNIDKLLHLEQQKYNDLIQGNFIDSYRNLSYKSLIAWKWIKNNCNKASYIIKLDDDVFLNIFKLKQILNNYNIFKSINNSFICYLYTRSKPIRDLKSIYSKWYVTQNEYNLNLYKNMSIFDDGYPCYCRGVGVVMTPDIISKLYLKSFQIKLFWIDDVYVGILGKYVNVKFENIAGFYSNDLNSRLNDFLFINGAETSIEIHKIWNLLNKI
jgi:hypothetical protein